MERPGSSEDQWPNKPKIKDVVLEEVVEENCNKVTSNELLAVRHRFENFKRVPNTIAYCIEAIEKDKSKNLNITAAEENVEATKAIFRSAQQESFKEDKQTHLQKLIPFLAADGSLFARGRLVKSRGLTFAQKQSKILDGKHHVTRIFLRTEYLKSHL